MNNRFFLFLNLFLLYFFHLGLQYMDLNYFVHAQEMLLFYITLELSDCQCVQVEDCEVSQSMCVLIVWKFACDSHLLIYLPGFYY